MQTGSLLSQTTDSARQEGRECAEKKASQKRSETGPAHQRGDPHFAHWQHRKSRARNSQKGENYQDTMHDGSLDLESHSSMACGALSGTTLSRSPLAPCSLLWVLPRRRKGLFDMHREFPTHGFIKRLFTFTAVLFLTMFIDRIASRTVRPHLLIGVKSRGSFKGTWSLTDCDAHSNSGAKLSVYVTVLCSVKTPSTTTVYQRCVVTAAKKKTAFRITSSMAHSRLAPNVPRA